MKLIAAMLLVLGVGVCSAPGATGKGDKKTPDKRIRLSKGVLTFPGGKTIRIAPPAVATSPDGAPTPPPARGWWKAADLSENGQLAAVLDLQTKSIAVYDATAKKLREIKIDYRFRRAQISNKGIIVADGRVRRISMEHIRQQSVIVYNPAGKPIKEFHRVLPGPTSVEFFNDGDLAVIVLGTPSFEWVRANGESWSRPLKPSSYSSDLDFVLGAVVVDPLRRRLVCTSLELGGVGTPISTRILVYNAVPTRPGARAHHEWTQAGAAFGPGSIALSPGGKRLLAIEPRYVRCFDLEKNRQEWIDVVGHPALGTIQTQRIHSVYAGAKRIVTAHLAPTGPGWRVVYSVYGVDGKPVHMFTVKSHSRAYNRLLSDPIGRNVDRPLWTVSKDGRILETLAAPKTKISLAP
jgi:hypothetical protein